MDGQDKSVEVGKPEGLGALVPEFFFDLISRVTPGTLLLVFVIVNEQLVGAGGRDWLKSLDASRFLCLAWGGYVVGMILSCFANGYLKNARLRAYAHFLTEDRPDFVDAVKSFATPRRLRIIDPSTGSVNSGMRQIEAEDLHRRVHDYLKNLHPTFATILPKLAAESALMFNLFKALMLCVLIDVSEQAVTAIRAGTYSFQHILVTLIGCTGVWATYAAGRFREERLVERELSALTLVSSGSLRTAEAVEPSAVTANQNTPPRLGSGSSATELLHVRHEGENKAPNPQARDGSAKPFADDVGNR